MTWFTAAGAQRDACGAAAPAWGLCLLLCLVTGCCQHLLTAFHLLPVPKALDEHCSAALARPQPQLHTAAPRFWVIWHCAWAAAPCLHGLQYAGRSDVYLGEA